MDFQEKEVEFQTDDKKLASDSTICKSNFGLHCEKRNLLNCCNLVSISKDIVFYVFEW